MKVKELIEVLKEHDQEAEIWISSDPEGNGYYKVYGADSAKMEPTRRNWADDGIYFDCWTDDECCLEPDERNDMEPIIVISP